MGLLSIFGIICGAIVWAIGGDLNNYGLWLGPLMVGANGALFFVVCFARP